MFLVRMSDIDIMMYLGPGHCRMHSRVGLAQGKIARMLEVACIP